MINHEAQSFSSPQNNRPCFSLTEVASLLSKHFGKTGTITELPSYSDQNFRVTCREAQFVLKIANATEPQEVLDFQQQAILHVHQTAPELRLPEVIRSREGTTLIKVPASNGRSHHLVWMVSYLPGQFLSDLPVHPPALLTSLGAFMGTLDRALSTFTHPAMHRDLNWDLQKAGQLHTLIDHIKDSDKQRLVLHFLERLEKQVAGRLASLRQSVIHNDANDNNVLAAGPTDAPFINGIIDFGDMVYSYTVGELAIAITYVMLGKSDPLQTAAYVLRGYHQVYPLQPDEIEVLFDLICLRLCTSVCMSARARSQSPDNAYLAVSEEPAWDMLSRLIHIPPEEATDKFANAQQSKS